MHTVLLSKPLHNHFNLHPTCYVCERPCPLITTGHRQKGPETAAAAVKPHGDKPHRHQTHSTCFNHPTCPSCSPPSPPPPKALEAKEQGIADVCRLLSSPEDLGRLEQYRAEVGHAFDSHALQAALFWSAMKTFCHSALRFGSVSRSSRPACSSAHNLIPPRPAGILEVEGRTKNGLDW